MRTYCIVMVHLQDKWIPDLRVRLEKFLTLALQAQPQPRLFELYVSFQKIRSMLYVVLTMRRILTIEMILRVRMVRLARVLFA